MNNESLTVQLELFSPEELFSIGEFIEEMYLVVKGCLSLKLGSTYDHMEVAQIWENHHIGEILLNKNYLEKLRCNGKGPKFIRVGKYVRYSPQDLEEWVNNLRRVSSTSDSIK